MTSETGEVELAIIVPVFNRNESLRRAVASIVSQSDRISVVIVDDGSTGEFAAIADKVAAAEGRSVRVVHQSNRGPAAARNVGLNCAASRFVMFLDSDDELADTALAPIDENLLRHEDVGLLCGAVRVVAPDGTARISYPVRSPAMPGAKLSALSGSFVVRSDIAEAVGGYDEALHFAENTDFILRLAEQCRKQSLTIAATDQVLSIYHQGFDERRYDTKRLNAAIHLLHRGRYDLKLPSERAKLHGIVAVNAARVGQYRLSIRHAALAVRSEPRNLRHVARLALSLTGPLARRRWLKS